MSEKYIIDGMSTVLVCPIAGLKRSEWNKFDEKVERKIKEVIDKLKQSHTKFEDPDFGPTEKDEYGAISFYGNGKPDPAGSKYPSPDTLKWERPRYDDKIFEEGSGKKEGEEGAGGENGEAEEKGEEKAEEEEDDEDDEEEDDDYGFGFGGGEDDIWCKHGRLFLDGSSSGDVIQGQLGDCWFLSALAVLGADGDLLESCFWRRDNFREYGLYVLRFFKDCNIIFVIIDDRLPVKAKDLKLIFAANKDPNELWVPLIEKAYAKLHGCYKALIGGYTHYGLADMTGFSPRLIVMKEGLLGFSEKYDADEIWDMLTEYVGWHSPMGCSIQPNPKEKNKVEADAGNGLYMGHAYSFLGADNIKIGVDAKGNPILLKMVKLRNPWGRGEWEGRFSDRSPEYDEHREEIERVFNANVKDAEKLQQNFNDGTFLMAFEDWLKYFTSLFVAIQFPEAWCGKRTEGKWSVDQGGNREMGTWITNPKFKIHLPKNGDKSEFKRVFIGLYIKDSRMTLGFDYFKDPLYATPLTFDVVTNDELQKFDAKAKRVFISNSRKTKLSSEQGKQPPYNFGTTQIDVFLETGIDYYIVPSLYKRNQAGSFFLQVYADVPLFELEGSTVISEAQKPMVVGKDGTQAVLKMSVSQFYERKEALRERIIAEATRLNLSLAQLESIFSDKDEELSRSAFKRRVMDLGFMLTDFPDDDLVVLDSNNDGTISPKEFLEFYKEGLKFVEQMNVNPPPEPPPDDLLFKSIDLSGVLSVSVIGGRQIREASSWFNVGKGEGEAAGSVPKSSRGLIAYDPKAAMEARAAAVKTRKSWGSLKKPPPVVEEPLQLDGALDDELSVDTSISEEDRRPLSPLRTLTSTMKDKRFDTASIAPSMMSLSKQEAIQTLADAAARKLHNDGLLQKAERSRTKHLSALRSSISRTKNGSNIPVGASMNGSIAAGMAKKPSSSQSQKDPDTMLRKKSTGPRRKKRDILKDVFAMRWLNYHPPVTISNLSAAAMIPVRSALPVGNNVPQITLSQPAPENSSNVQGTKNGLLKNDASVDLWDYLIDCVITISLARPKVSAPTSTGNASSASSSSTSSSSSMGLMKHEAFMSMRSKRKIKKDSYILTKSNEIPVTPRTEVIKPVRGHTPTPRSQRRAVGAASVNSHQSKNMIRSLANEVPDKLFALSQSSDCFEEVYRRIMSVATTSYEELAGERTILNPLSLSSQSTAYILSLFQKFDKNCNGFISKDEFKFAMKELNVEVTNEECDIFFNRFSCHVPGNIDYHDFLHFFEHNIVGATNTLSHEEAQHRPTNNLIHYLVQLHDVLRRTMDEMQRSNINSIEKFFEHNSCNLKIISSPRANPETPNPKGLFRGLSTQESTESLAAFPDNAILPSLELKQTKANTAVLQSLGMTNLRVKDMARISRIFSFNICTLMEFVRLPSVDLIWLLDTMDTEICKELSARSGASIVRGDTNAGTNDKDKLTQNIPMPSARSAANAAVVNPVGANNTEPTTASTTKIWNAFSASVDSPASFDTMVKYFNDVMSDSQLFRKAATVSSETKDPNPALTIENVKLDVLNRIVVDILIHSSWNKSTSLFNSEASKSGTKTEGDGKNGNAGNDLSLPSWLSFSGLDAYLRINRIHYIERKLKYLMQLESNMSGNTTHLLVHVYLSSATGSSPNEMLIVADDPLSGEVFTLQLKDPSFATLPRGNMLRHSSIELYNWDQITRNVMLTLSNRPGGQVADIQFDDDALYLYNPFDTPIEDGIITEFLKRLRLVRSRRTGISELIITEDPKLVLQLKALLDNAAANLPFFYIVNQYYLSFEVDDQLLMQENNRISIRSLVFGCLRKQKALYGFLSQVTSSLRVVLSTYNNSLKESLTWEEMLAHLTNHRNPFVTIQLLPKFIPPKKYMYEPVEVTGAFEGDEEEAEEDDDSEDENGESETKNNTDDILPPLPKHANWQRGIVDFDGAPNPRWNSSFKFNFQSPKLTACRIISTEVVKILLDEIWKYVMVMVREGSLKTMDTTTNPTKPLIIREPFRFLTLYDPKTATEYQCGVKPETQLYKYLRTKPIKMPTTALNSNAGQQKQKKGGSEDFKFPYEVKDLMQALNDAADEYKLILGPAVTPRLEIQVFNHQDDKVKELLGQCQVSISSVLSGSGIGEKAWVTLTYKIEKPPKEGSENANKSLLAQALAKGKENEGKAEKTIDSYAGQIQVDLSFRRLIEIEAERQALADRLRKKQSGEAVSRASTRQNTPRPSVSATAAKDAGGQHQETKSKTVVSASSASAVDKESEAKIKQLSQENQKLQAEYNKLKEELAGKKSGPSAGSEVASTVTSTTSPQSKEESEQLMAKMQKDNETLAKVLKDLQKEKEQMNEEKQKLEQEKAGLLKNKQEEDDEKQRLKEQLQRLQEAYAKVVEQQKGTEEANEEKKQTTGAATGAADVNVSSAAPVSTNLTSMSCADPIAFSALIRHLLTIFIQRYEKRMKKIGNLSTTGPPSASNTATSSAMNVLDGFFRLLQSYGNAEGLIGYKEIVLACQEVLIEISTEQAVRIVQEIGPNAKKMIQVHQLMDYLSREYNQMVKQQRKPSTSVPRASGEFAPGGLSNSGSNTSLMDQKAKASNKKAPDAGEADTANESEKETKEAPRSPPPRAKGANRGSLPPMSQTMRSRSTIDVPDDNNEGKGQTAGKRRPVSANATVNIPILPKTPKPKQTAPKDDKTSEVTGTGEKNWDVEPLPEGWDRKYSEKHKRYVYLDHASKKTQWFHPLQPDPQHS